MERDDSSLLCVDAQSLYNETTEPAWTESGHGPYPTALDSQSSSLSISVVDEMEQTNKAWQVR